MFSISRNGMYPHQGLSRIPTYPSSRRIHHRKEEIFATGMVFCTMITKPPLILIRTLGANQGGRLVAIRTRDQGWIVSCHDFNFSFVHRTFEFGIHLQEKACRTTEIILVEDDHSGLENILQLLTHFYIFSSNPEYTQMAATL